MTIYMKIIENQGSKISFLYQLDAVYSSIIIKTYPGAYELWNTLGPMTKFHKYM